MFDINVYYKKCYTRATKNFSKSHVRQCKSLRKFAHMHHVLTKIEALALRYMASRSSLSRKDFFRWSMCSIFAIHDPANEGCMPRSHASLIRFQSGAHIKLQQTVVQSKAPDNSIYKQSRAFFQCQVIIINTWHSLLDVVVACDASQAILIGLEL